MMAQEMWLTTEGVGCSVATHAAWSNFDSSQYSPKPTAKSAIIEVHEEKTVVLYQYGSYLLTEGDRMGNGLGI